MLSFFFCFDISDKCQAVCASVTTEKFMHNITEPDGAAELLTVLHIVEGPVFIMNFIAKIILICGNIKFKKKIYADTVFKLKIIC